MGSAPKPYVQAQTEVAGERERDGEINVMVKLT